MTSFRSVRAVVALASLLMLLLSAGKSSAQSASMGRIRGVVSDSAGGVLGEVYISIREGGTGIDRTALIGREGTFGFERLPAGEYTLRFERVGFAPFVITGIPVRPGQTVNVRPVLRNAGAGAASIVEEKFDGAALSTGRPGASEWVREYHLALPFWNDAAGELTRLSTHHDVDGGGEGLPAYLAGAAIDGFPFRRAVHPFLPQSFPYSNAIALTGVRGAEFVLSRADAEWSGASAGVLGLYSLAGSPASDVMARGSFGSSVFSKPGSFDAGSLSYNDIRGAFTFAGPALADSARISIGISVRRSETPVAPEWNASAAASAAAAAANDALGTDISAVTRPSIAKDDAASGFAHLDWRVAQNHSLGVTVRAASVSTSTILDRSLVVAAPATGRDFLAGSTLSSRLGERSLNSLQLSIASSRIETDAVTSAAPTSFVGEQLRFGTAAARSLASENTIRVFDALEHDAGSHRIKFGAELDWVTYDYSYRRGTAAEFLFGSVQDFDAGIGTFARTTGPVPSARWDAPRVAFFAQDAWSNGEGLDVTIGFRFDHETLKLDGINADEDFRDLTGISNDTVPTSGWRVSPRVGVSWDVKGLHRWIIDVSASVVQDRTDPRLVNELIIDDGTATVERASGLLAGWPDGDPAAVTTRRLTLFSPGFRAPETTRLSGGLTHSLAGGAVVMLSGAYRDTRYLPRIMDLNLFPGTLFRDQFGRPVFGELEQHTGVVTAKPGSNRRFTTYDEVAAIQSDAHSRYYGATIGVDRSFGARLAGMLRYTYSRTADNWIGASFTGVGMLRPTGLEATGDWSEGTSDFDTPHRAVVALAYSSPWGVQLSALYRRESGLPFTPGFAAGVDVNADGNGENDPAFVSSTIVGTDAAIAEWSCLASQSGRFAERNSCRGSATNGLDVKASTVIHAFGKMEPMISVEVFDVLATGSRAANSALYLIDPTGSLSVTGSKVALPLVINPNFGMPVERGLMGRRVRLGVSLNW